MKALDQSPNCQFQQNLDLSPVKQEFFHWAFNSDDWSRDKNIAKAKLLSVIFECFFEFNDENSYPSIKKCMTLWFGKLNDEFIIAAPFKVMNRHALLLEKNFKKINGFSGRFYGSHYKRYLSPFCRYEAGEIIKYDNSSQSLGNEMSYRLNNKGKEFKVIHRKALMI